MAIITASVKVDALLEYADLEWSDFLLDSLLSGYARGLNDAEPLIDEQDMKAGKVDLTTAGDRLVNVVVEIDHTQRSKDAAGQEIAHAQAPLERDLEKYRPFLLDRCERMQCRPS